MTRLDRVRIFVDGYVTGLIVGFALLAGLSFLFANGGGGTAIQIGLVVVLLVDAVVVAVRMRQPPIEIDDGVLVVRSHWRNSRLPLGGPVHVSDDLHNQRHVLFIRIGDREARATTTTYSLALNTLRQLDIVA
jgi:hypothetical protein